MKCAACGWPNAGTEPLCFNCNAPLQPVRTASAEPAAGQDVFARPTARVGATLIDGGLMVAGAGVVLTLGWWATPATSAHAGRWLAATVVLTLLALFLPAMLDAWAGGSIGKRAMQIRVVTAAAQPPGVLRSALRHLFKYGGHLAIPVLLFVFEHLLFGPRHLHEVVARTYVVNADADADDIRRATAGRTRGHFVGAVLGVVVTAAALLVAGAVVAVLLAAPKQDAASMRTSPPAAPATAGSGTR